MTTNWPVSTYFDQANSGASSIGRSAAEPTPSVPDTFWNSDGYSGAEAIGKDASSSFDPYGIGQETTKATSAEKEAKRKQALELAKMQQEQRGGQQSSSMTAPGSSAGTQGNFGTGVQYITPTMVSSGGRSGNSILGALGGAATGALAGSSLGPWGMAVGALGGGLSAFG